MHRILTVTAVLLILTQATSSAEEKSVSLRLPGGGVADFSQFIVGFPLPPTIAHRPIAVRPAIPAYRADASMRWKVRFAGPSPSF